MNFFRNLLILNLIFIGTTAVASEPVGVIHLDSVTIEPNGGVKQISLKPLYTGIRYSIHDCNVVMTGGTGEPFLFGKFTYYGYTYAAAIDGNYDWVSDYGLVGQPGSRHIYSIDFIEGSGNAITIHNFSDRGQTMTVSGCKAYPLFPGIIPLAKSAD